MHGFLPGMKEFLGSRERGELADLLLSVAEYNDQLRERLNQLKRRAEGHAVDLEGFKRNITLACSTPRYIDYRHIGEVSQILRSNGYEQSWQEFVERLKTRHPRKMERVFLPP